MKKNLKKLVVFVMTLAIFSLPLTMLPVSAESTGEGVTFYFKNVHDWESVYCYVWSDSGTVGENWPGAACTAVVGYDGWYSFTYTSTSPINAMFNNNNNGEQTGNHDPGNLGPAVDAYWFIPGNESESTAGGYATGYSLSVYTEAQAEWPGYVAPTTTTTSANTTISTAATSTNSNSNPKTGDNSIAVCIATMGLAVVAGLCIIKNKKYNIEKYN